MVTDFLFLVTKKKFIDVTPHKKCNPSALANSFLLQNILIPVLIVGCMQETPVGWWASWLCEVILFLAVEFHRSVAPTSTPHLLSDACAAVFVVQVTRGVIFLFY